MATHTARAAWSFPTFSAALDAMRRTIRRGAQTAVLRLYDGIESERNFHVDRSNNVLLAFDEGDEAIVEAGMAVLREECAEAEPLDDALVEQWFGHRNDVAALEALISKGYVVDTMEVSAPWSRLDAIYDAAVAAISAVPGTLAASAHQSHSYVTGACLYFTFAAQVDAGEREAYYRAVWDAGTRAVLAHGGSLSHHHAVGINRARFVPEALGAVDERLDAVGSSIWAVYELRQYARSMGPRVAPVRKAEEPGRNDPCPCGSGKKYKKCHGAG